MKKWKIVILLSLVIPSLAACGNGNQKSVSFSRESYVQVKLEQENYVITNQQIPEKSLSQLIAIKHQIDIVDIQTGKMLDKSQKQTVTLALNNIYKTDDGSLCVGVNDSYYKMVPTTEKKSQKLLDVAAFQESSVDVPIVIDSGNVQRIHIGKNSYTITEELVQENQLSTQLGTLYLVKTFDKRTKKEIPKEDLSKLDDGHHLSKQDREVWEYGAVYALQNSSAIAIEINDQLHRADKN